MGNVEDGKNKRQPILISSLLVVRRVFCVSRACVCYDPRGYALARLTYTPFSSCSSSSPSSTAVLLIYLFIYLNLEEENG